MLNVSNALSYNTENVNLTAVHNGRRRLAPNRYTVAIQALESLLDLRREIVAKYLEDLRKNAS